MNPSIEYRSAIISCYIFSGNEINWFLEKSRVNIGTVRTALLQSDADLDKSEGGAEKPDFYLSNFSDILNNFIHWIIEFDLN